MRRVTAWILATAVVLGGVTSALVTSPVREAAPRPEAIPAPSPAAAWATNGTVWDLVRVGDAIYLGGEFTALVSPDGSQTRARSNLAAISASTGQPLPWAPAANGAVLALESSADGTRIFVGGHYTVIGGVSRARLASVRISDGTVDVGFTATASGRVRSLLRQGTALYVGGEFTSVSNVTRRMVARVDARTGAVTPGWDPAAANGAVRGMTLSPDGTRLYLAGSFTAIDAGTTTRYLAAVTASTGALSSWRAPVDQPLFDVAAAGTGVYLAVGGPGIPNNRLQKHDATTGAELFRYIADGDLQDLEVSGTTLYAGGHWDTDFGGLGRTMLVAFDLRDDHLLEFAPHVEGLYGIWKVLAGPEGVWLAGQFTRIDGELRRGFAFLPNASPAPAETRLLVDRFGAWRHRPDAPPAGWTARTFADSTWASGRAEIGFGDGDEVTRIAATRQLYLRRTFNVADRSAWRVLRLRVLADAGAAVYLNGTEVARDNLPAGPLTHDTRALSSKWTRGERTFVEFDVPASLLVTGSNTLAVQVHTAPNPEDLSFSLELLGVPATGTTRLTSADQVWRVRATGTSPPANWTSRSYDAAGWGWGRGQMGAGDGDETTVINRLSPAHVTDWFRAWFPVSSPGRYRWAQVRLLADDGAVVYVNGTAVARDNMPSGAISPSTPASSARSGTSEQTWRTFAIPPHLLVEGANLIAVEVHQTAASDPDSSFAADVYAGT